MKELHVSCNLVMMFCVAFMLSACGTITFSPVPSVTGQGASASHVQAQPWSPPSTSVTSLHLANTFPSPPADFKPPFIAVWRLTPLGDIPAADADVLTETLRTQLSKSGWFRIVAREEMGKILKEAQIQLSDACDNAQCAVEYGKLLTAEKMVIGSIGRLGNTYAMTIKLVSVETGESESIVEERLTGRPDDLFRLPEACAAELLRRIGGPADTASAPETQRTAAMGFITIQGAVHSPGQQAFSANDTLFDVVQRSRPAAYAKLTEVKVLRGAVTFTVDLSKPGSGIERPRDGDQIAVPARRISLF